MKRLLKFVLIIITTFVLMGVSIAVLSTVPAESLSNLQAKMDAVWWTVSLVRWLFVVLLLLFVVPWYLTFNLNKLQARGEGLLAELKRADRENATYETKATLENQLYATEKMHDFYEMLNHRRRYIALAFIAVEVIAVQLPHLI